MYCLSVPDMGAFVAGGIVVSNCAYSCAFVSRGGAHLSSREEVEDDDWGDDKSDDYEEDRGRSGYGGSLY